MIKLDNTWTKELKKDNPNVVMAVTDGKDVVGSIHKVEFENGNVEFGFEFVDDQKLTPKEKDYTHRSMQSVFSHMKKLEKKLVSESAGEDVLNESIIKTLKRVFAGWPGAVDTDPNDSPPINVMKRVKALSDDELLQLLSKNYDKDGHSPAALQQKLIRREMKRRGLNEEVLNESFKNPEDLAKALPKLRAINQDTVIIPNTNTMFDLKKVLQKKGYEYNFNTKVWKKGKSSIGINWDDNRGTGGAVMWEQNMLEEKVDIKKLKGPFPFIAKSGKKIDLYNDPKRNKEQWYIPQLDKFVDEDEAQKFLKSESLGNYLSEAKYKAGQVEMVMSVDGKLSAGDLTGMEDSPFNLDGFDLHIVSSKKLGKNYKVKAEFSSSRPIDPRGEIDGLYLDYNNSKGQMVGLNFSKVTILNTLEEDFKADYQKYKDTGDDKSLERARSQFKKIEKNMSPGARGEWTVKLFDSIKEGFIVSVKNKDKKYEYDTAPFPSKSEAQDYADYVKKMDSNVISAKVLKEGLEAGRGQWYKVKYTVLSDKSTGTAAYRFEKDAQHYLKLMKNDPDVDPKSVKLVVEEDLNNTMSMLEEGKKLKDFSDEELEKVIKEFPHSIYAMEAKQLLRFRKKGIKESTMAEDYKKNVNSIKAHDHMKTDDKGFLEWEQAKDIEDLFQMMKSHGIKAKAPTTFMGLAVPPNVQQILNQKFSGKGSLSDIKTVKAPTSTKMKEEVELDEEVTYVLRGELKSSSGRGRSEGIKARLKGKKAVDDRRWRWAKDGDIKNIKLYKVDKDGKEQPVVEEGLDEAVAPKGNGPGTGPALDQHQMIDDLFNLSKGMGRTKPLKTYKGIQLEGKFSDVLLAVQNKLDEHYEAEKQARLDEQKNKISGSYLEQISKDMAQVNGTPLKKSN